MDFLKSVDTWFLVLAVVILAIFFVWAVQYLFNGLKTSIENLGISFQNSVEKLEKMISNLYAHRNDHESRLVALETKCVWEHGVEPPAYNHPRLSPGRRTYDPPTLPKETE